MADGLCLSTHSPKHSAATVAGQCSGIQWQVHTLPRAELNGTFVHFQSRLPHSCQPLCSISRPAGPGFILSFAGAAAVEVRAGGEEVKLGGRAWTAHVIDGDTLQLTNVTPSDNGRERVEQRVAVLGRCTGVCCREEKEREEEEHFV